MKSCPPVTLNVDAVVEAAKKEILAACPTISDKVSAEVHQVGVRGLGKIALIENQVKYDQFILGFVTVPTAVNFATKLMELGLILPKADMAVSRGVAAGLTLVGTLLSGGKSFLLGAFLGQFSSTVDALADVVIKEIATAKSTAVAVPSLLPGVAPDEPLEGISSAEDEISKLREDLQKLQGVEPARMGSVRFTY